MARKQARRPLGEILVSLGMATQADVQKALDLQKQGDQRPLGQIVLAVTQASSEDVARALAIQFGIDYVDLDRTPIHSEAVTLVTKDFAWEHIVLPFQFEDDAVRVAIFDPLYQAPLLEIHNATKKRVMPCLATIEALDRALRRCYQGSPIQPSPLRPPPLSERKDDLRRLIGLFLKDFSSQSGWIMKISRDALHAFLAYPWTSVRELLDAVEESCKSATNDTIRVQHLPEALQPYAGTPASEDEITAET